MPDEQENLKKNEEVWRMEEDSMGGEESGMKLR
jgi:hypothetical protein